MNESLQNSSQLLKKIKHHKGDKITVEEIMTIFREGGFSLLLIIFASPLALPLPALGIAQIMAVPILILATQLTMGRQSLWMPQKIAKKEMNMQNLCSIIDKAIPWLEKIEYFVKPRLIFFSSSAGHRVIGLFCLICAISVAVPIPFSNTVPSMGIVLMSIGLLERDGLVILAGMCVGFIGICLTSIVIFFGAEAIRTSIDAIFS